MTDEKRLEIYENADEFDRTYYRFLVHIFCYFMLEYYYYYIIPNETISSLLSLILVVAASLWFLKGKSKTFAGMILQKIYGIFFVFTHAVLFSSTIIVLIE